MKKKEDKLIKDIKKLYPDLFESLDEQIEFEKFVKRFADKTEERSTPKQKDKKDVNE